MTCDPCFGCEGIQSIHGGEGGAYRGDEAWRVGQGRRRPRLGRSYPPALHS